MSVSSAVPVKRLQLLDIANLYNNIRPGDTTHEDIHLTYNEYFVKFGRRMKVFIQTSTDEVLQQFPCFVLQVSYNQCIRCILYGEVMEQFHQNLPNFELPDQLMPFYQSDQKRYSTSNKQNIGQIFKFTPLTTDLYKEDWELLKARYGCLLYLSEARSHQPFNILINEVLDILPVCEGLSEDTVKLMVEKAVHLAWDMVTLVPPALVCQPSQYHEEWHEKRITYWSEESSPHPLIYIRPVLFFSALGHVGCKGIIGNTIARDMKIVQCTYSNDIKLSSSELSLQAIETDVNTSLTSPLLDETKDDDSIEELNINANGSITLLSDECNDKEITTKRSRFIEQTVSPAYPRKSKHNEESLEFGTHSKHINTTTVEELPINKANDWPTMRFESINEIETKPAYVEEGRICTIANEARMDLDSTANLLKNKLQLLKFANLYSNTAPTLKDIMSLFNEFFAKFSRLIKVFIQSSTNGIIQQFPCFVLQVAYEQCHNYVLNQLLVILKPSLSQLGLKKQLSSIDKMFSLMSSIDEEDWELLKAQYGSLLLYLSQASSCQPFNVIIDKVLDILPVCEGLSEDKVKEIVEKAVQLAWDMVTLVPPALVCQPSQYCEEWHEKRIAYWSENSSPHPLIYIRPVLFFSALGHIGYRGIIGNSTTTNMKIVHCTDTMSTGQLSHEELQPQLSLEEECSDNTTKYIVHGSTNSIYDHLIDINEAESSLWRNMPDYENSEMLLQDCSQCGRAEFVPWTNNRWICQECRKMVHVRHDQTRTRRRRWWFITCFHPQTNSSHY